MGNGEGLEVDVVVDLVEGMILLVEGWLNFIIFIVVVDKGSMWDLGNSFYMNKIVVEVEVKSVIDIIKLFFLNFYNIVEVLGCNVEDFIVFVFDKFWYMFFIEEIW